MPFVFSAWAFRDPSSPLPGPRIEVPQWGRGLGDISVTSRAWIFKPGTHPDWNIAAGGGIKFPTGNEGYQDTFVDVRGAVPGILGVPVPGWERHEMLQYVDQSAQPGDGGVGPDDGVPGVLAREESRCSSRLAATWSTRRTPTTRRRFSRPSGSTRRRDRTSASA